MPPASEPTQTDVASVQAMLDGAPAPQPGTTVQPTAAPVQAPPAAPAQQPSQPTPQPAPSQQPAGDPFESLFTPTEPAAPQAPAPQPTQPTEPSAPSEPVPTPQPTPPVETPQPTTTPATTPTPQTTSEEQYQSYDDYMKEAIGNLPPAPELPDHSKISPDDEAGIKNFFDNLVNTAVERAKQETARTNAIQATERTLWDAAFDKYGSLRKNKELRDMVHSIRMGHFQKGVAITPTQAADKLLGALKAKYQEGVADNTVVTTIESTQPQGGQSGQPVPTTLDKQNVLLAIQDGGETALAEHLDAEIKAGRM